MNPSDDNSDPLRLIDEARKNKRFWYACRNGKLKKARRLLRQGADVNVERRCFILKRGRRDEGSDSEMISDDSGADSDAETLRRNPEGFWAACSAGNMEEAQRQMWYYKMKRKHPELWRNHMPEESDWDSDDEQEDRDNQREKDDRYKDLGKVSALYVAIKRAHFDIALHLLDQPGIDNLAKKYTKEKETVLHRAVAKEAEDVYQKLLKHPDACELGESKDKDGDSAIQMAVIFGDVVATRVLLASEFGNPHSLESLLFLAASHRRSRPPKNVDVARLLLMNGARLGLEDGDGKTTALQAACAREDVGMVKLLLAWKAPRIPVGRDDALRLAGDELWQNKDETKPAWSNSISRQHEISANFNIEITFSCALDVNGDGSYTRNWTRSMPIKDFMGTRPTEENLLTQLEEEFVSDTEDDGVNIEPEDIVRWIHIPHTNMTWVKDVVAKLCESYGETESEKQYYMSRFVDATACARNTAGNSYCRFPHVQCQHKIDGTITSSKISLVVPFIDFESERYLSPHANRLFPVLQKQRDLWDLESQFGPYNGSVGLQRPETLDQAYHDGYTALNQTDKDQVVYKWLKERNCAPGPIPTTGEAPAAEGAGTAIPALGRVNPTIQNVEGPEPTAPGVAAPFVTETATRTAGGTNPPTENAETPETNNTPLKLLMVRQLWMWKLDERTILTAMPPRWDGESKETLFEIVSRCLPLHAWSTPHALVQQILLQCLRLPDEFEQSGLGYHILDIFESWIAKQENEEVGLFKDFRQFVEDHDTDRENHGLDHESLKIGGEVQIIYELKDVLGELAILKQLFTNQKEIAERYHSTCPQGDGSISYETFIQQSRIRAFIDRVDRLEANATRVLAAVDHLVSVKQAQGSFIVSKLANIEAVKSRQLNNYVLLLTAVTIVFTPLAFMLALFAISIEGFPHDDTGEPFYRSSWITGRLFAGELVSLFAISLGFLAIKNANKRDEENLKQRLSRENSIVLAVRGILEGLRQMVHPSPARSAQDAQGDQNTNNGVAQTDEVPLADNNGGGTEATGEVPPARESPPQLRQRGAWRPLRGGQQGEPDLELQEVPR